jgi:hypothetical protein
MTALLIAYVVFLLFIGGFAIAALYHVRKYRYKGDRSGLVTAVYLAAMGTVFVASLILVFGTDWSGS